MSGCHVPEMKKDVFKKKEIDEVIFLVLNEYSKLENDIIKINIENEKMEQVIKDHCNLSHKSCDNLSQIINDTVRLLIKSDSRLENDIIKLQLENESIIKEIKELKLFQNVTHRQYVYMLANKKPYKCPVCEGCGNDKGVQVQNPDYQFSIKYASCNSCEGKGIIWG